MKKRKVIFGIFISAIFLIAILLLVFIKTKNYNETIINLTDEEKIQDFEYLCDILDGTYPFWNEVAERGIDKNLVYEKYKNEVQEANTDIEFMELVRYFLNEFKGYGHLSVLDGYMYDLYDKTFALGLAELNDMEMKRMKPWYDVLYNPISKETYSLLDSSHTGFRSIKGLKNEYTEQNSSITAEQETREENLLFDIIVEDEIAYLKIYSFDFANIQTDSMKLQNFFNKVAQYPHLIIDLQDNSGGSDKYWKELIVSPNLSEAKAFERYFLVRQKSLNSPFLNAYFDESDILPIEKLPRFEKLQKDNLPFFTNYVIAKEIIYSTRDEKQFNGKIWVLTNPKVYSSSENFIMFCKNTGFATLVGTSTGGDGGIADPILLSLPNSGLIIRFSMFYGLNNDGTGNEAIGTLPNIMIKDDENALDICISQIND